MGLKSWPKNERPRERLVRHGAGALGDAELLAMLLGTGVAGGADVYDLSMLLLDRFDGAGGLDAAPLCELLSVRGVGPARAALIKAALELGRRSLAAAPGKAMRTSGDLYLHYRARFHNADREQFICVFLDTGLRLIGDCTLAVGSASQCLVDTRLLLKEALVRGACSIAVLHNHPSGERLPSAEDRALTRRIAEAAAAVGLKLIDHLVVGEGGYFSFADEGALGGNGNSTVAASIR